MARGPCNFRERDVRAAAKAAREAGVQIARIEVVDGKIIIIAKEAAESDSPNEPEVIL